VRAVSGTGSLEGGRDTRGAAGIEVGERVKRPPGSVEVARQQLAEVAGQERVDARRRPPGEVGDDDVVCQRRIVGSCAPSGAPATPYRRRPSGLAGRCVLPARRVHIVAANEERTVQPHLLFRGAMDADRGKLVVVREESRSPRIAVNLGAFLLPDSEELPEAVVLAA
jgi:hypothetical protein